MATQTTGGGSTTSFSNAPQASNDTYQYSEDYILNNDVLILNVMANNSGGAAKSLFSIDDGTSVSTSTKVYAPADLLDKGCFVFVRCRWHCTDGRQERSRSPHLDWHGRKCSL